MSPSSRLLAHARVLCASRDCTTKSLGPGFCYLTEQHGEGWQSCMLGALACSTVTAVRSTRLHPGVDQANSGKLRKPQAALADSWEAPLHLDHVGGCSPGRRARPDDRAHAPGMAPLSSAHPHWTQPLGAAETGSVVSSNQELGAALAAGLSTAVGAVPS